MVYKLCFWCMDPSLAFKILDAEARSVVLTSGTLSPLDSFAKELGIPFVVRLEAPHVINPARQLYAVCQSMCPKGVPLLGKFANVQRYDYQDGVGHTLLGLAKVVPDGMLVFFTSYRTLDTVVNRWQMTGLMGRLEQHKAVFSECRGSADFPALLASFRTSVGDGKPGAILLAVCRGKVSEGMDFRDHDARAVVLVGIPYPALKDPQVTLKQQFQETKLAQERRSKPKFAPTVTLSGSEWYTQQAFRALNQGEVIGFPRVTCAAGLRGGVFTV